MATDCSVDKAACEGRENGQRDPDGSQRCTTPVRDGPASATPSPHASPARASTARKAWQQSTLPGASPGLMYSFHTYVVGRQYQQPPAQCADGDVVSIVHETDNPRDR